MRLIDADAFKMYMRNALEETRNCYLDGGEWAATITEEFCKDIDEQPTIEERKWIPCTERLPEEDKEVLISYRYKEGEGDMSHVEIDITTYGQMYFGGNKVGDYKHWRAPFEYFESNYEVIAWMPLPEAYR